MDDTILDLLKEFVLVTLIPWGIFWLIAAFSQWAWFLCISSSDRDLVLSELESSLGYERDPQFEVEAPWYIRLLFGLPPTRGMMGLTAAQIQLVCMICALINWLWLRITGDYSANMQLTVRKYLVFLAIFIIILFQKLLAYKFPERKPSPPPVSGPPTQQVQRIPTNTLVLLIIGISIVTLFLGLKILDVLGEGRAIYFGAIVSLSSFVFGLSGFVYIRRQEYPLSSTHCLRGERAVKQGTVIVIIGWGIAILNLIVIFLLNGQ